MISANEVVEDALARSAIVEARVQELETQLRLTKSGSRSRTIRTEAQVNAQAAKAAKEVLSARSSDLQADVDAEARQLLLEDALARAVGESAVIPSPNKSPANMVEAGWGCIPLVSRHKKEEEAKNNKIKALWS